MSADRISELGGDLEGQQPSVTPPAERGSERFPWKSLLLTLGLTAAGLAVGSFVFKPFDVLPVETFGLRGMATGFAGAIGFATGVALTAGFNILREDVLYLRGHGELHPKSPGLSPRG